MRNLMLSGCTITLMCGLLAPVPASAGFTLPDGDPCLKNDNGKGLVKDGDLAKLLAVMANRCSNAGGGNGSETQIVGGDGSVYLDPTGPEAADTDPGKSGAHNKAGKKK